MKYVCPLIVVEDVKRSRKLYESILGQKVKTDFGDNVTFEGDFSIHRKEHFRALIGGAAVAPKSNSFELYFEVDDPGPIVDKLKLEGLEFLHELREQPWRQKVARFYDYDGNMIEIGERLEHAAYRLSLEGMPIAEISRLTYLPEQAVEGAIIEYSE